MTSGFDATRGEPPLVASDWTRARNRLVDELAARGITDARVLAALRQVPRHELVPEATRSSAYDDRALPIGDGQTISQPYVVALMTQAARIAPGDRVLDIGTGSGYQAAILAAMGAEVYSIEIVPALAERARRDLERIGARGVSVRVGDGYGGWPEAAPFAAIIVAAAAPRVPAPLLAQLADGGRLVLPVGGEREAQDLEVHERRGDAVSVSRLLPVRFVPMKGEVER